MLLLLERRAVVKKLLICGVAAALAGGLQLYLSAGEYSGFVSKTVTTVTEGETDRASITPRLQTWDDAWVVFLNHPLNGVGAGAYGGGVHELGIARNVPEAELKTTNLWLEVLAELGLLGLSALLAMLVIAVFGLWRARRREPLATFVITAIVASAAMFPFVQTFGCRTAGSSGSSPSASRSPCSQAPASVDDSTTPAADACMAGQADPTPPDVV